jgi:hypothetical protein
MQAAPRKFLFRFLGVMSPMIVVLLLLELFLWRAGEMVSIETVIAHHGPGSRPAAYAPTLIDVQMTRLHFGRIVAQRPEVLVLGNSRVARFRAEMFAAGANFYNASWCMRSPRDFADFISALPPDYAPRTLLVGVDEAWFNPKLEAPPHVGADLEEDEFLEPPAHAAAYKNLGRALIRRDVTLSTIWRVMIQEDGGVKRYGLGAWTSRGWKNDYWRLGGFRNDGSLQEFTTDTPDHFQDPWSPPMEARVRQEHWPFKPAPAPDPALMQQFCDALAVLEARGTRIIGFIPPCTRSVWNAIAENPELHGFFEQAKDAIVSNFAARGWSLFDARFHEDFGFDETCMSDGIHARDTFHVALLLRMGRDPAVREALRLEPVRLEAALYHPATTVWYPVYDQDPRRMVTESAVDIPPDRL